MTTNPHQDFSGFRRFSPLPLEREVSEPTQFPAEELGTLLADAILTIADVTQTPVAICGNSVLAAVALAVQPLADISIHGRVYPLSEYFLTIAESGDRKSSVDRVALHAHAEHEKRLAVKYRSDMAEYRRAKAAYDERLTKSGATDSAGEEPQLPATPIFMCEEPTYEGLVKLLDYGRPSVGLFSDEGARFFKGHSMSKENGAKTAAGLSSLWDGRSITRVRASETASVLFGKRLSLHLMMQPVVSRDVFGDNFLREQGLLSRCLVTCPASVAGTRRYQPIDVYAEPAVRAYHERMATLLEVPQAYREGSRNELTPRRVTFSNEAMHAWVRHHDDIERRLSSDGALSAIKPFASKAAEHTARLASLLALFADPWCMTVDERYVVAGVKLIDHYMTEALRLVDLGRRNPGLANAQRVLDWLMKRSSQEIALPEIYQRGPSAVRDAKEARKAMEILAEHGYVEPLPLGAEYSGKRCKEAWRLLQAD